MANIMDRNHARIFLFFALFNSKCRTEKINSVWNYLRRIRDIFYVIYKLQFFYVYFLY